MEDLPLFKIAALVPEFTVKYLPLGRTLMVMMMMLMMMMMMMMIKESRSVTEWFERHPPLGSPSSRLDRSIQLVGIRG